MNYKTRHRMFITAVVAFVVLTTTLSLYATGYRLNWRSLGNWNQLLVKTGALMLESNPKGAKISITSASGNYHEVNLKPGSGSLTPLRINNLMPGEYLLTLSLDGYWPYQKKFTIFPEQTTNLDQIILFRKSLPMKVISTSGANFNYRDDGHYVALLDDNLILNLSEERTVAKITPSTEVTWPEATQQAVNGVMIIDLDKSLINDYTALTGPAASGYLTGDKLFYLQDQKLISFDTKTNQSLIIANVGTAAAYQVQGNTLIVAAKGAQETKVSFFDTKSAALLKETSLLAADNLRLEKIGPYAVLIDYDHKLSYLINPSENGVQHLLRDTSLVRWLDTNRVVYAVGSEIRIYDLAQEKDYLVTRLSEVITDLSPGLNYHLIYATNSQLGAINLRDNDKDITELFRGDKISHLKFDSNSADLYFFTAIGSNSGLYKINLK